MAWRKPEFVNSLRLDHYSSCRGVNMYILSYFLSFSLSPSQQVLVDLVLDHCCGHSTTNPSSCEKDKNKEGGDSSSLTFLDLCCGSGAIAISLLHDNPGLRGYAVDQSEDAVALTKENALQYVRQLVRT